MKTGLRRGSRLALFVTALGIASFPAHAAYADCGSPANAIEAENCRPGRPPSEWDVSGAGDARLQGFATDISVNRGETVSFKIDTTASAYRIDIYRLGYYQGHGARLVATLPNAQVAKADQPACMSQVATTGLVDCGNWSVSASWAVPADAVSGIYVARLVGEADGVGASHVVFVVRHDGSTSDLLFQTSDTTWQASNRYGGASLVAGTGSGSGRAYEVSYNRPFTTRETSPEDWLFNAEVPMVRWLERNGYDVTYSTGVDTDRRGGELLDHKVFLSVGHDGYWSGRQRANVEAARDASPPVHLAFFSGNGISWKTRWEASIDGSSTPYRTLVCHEETPASPPARIDPSSEWTGPWRQPFTVNGVRHGNLAVPEADGKMRFWRDTPNVATLAPGEVWSAPKGTLGHAWDADRDDRDRPPGLVRLSSLSVDVPGGATHHAAFHKRPSGALVFEAGTVRWSWGLDGSHGRGGDPESVDMQQATVNLLADMGVQPATLQAGLSPAWPSTDAVAPASDIASPAKDATVTLGTPVTIQGTATDGPPGVVGGVEVSVDGGTTWQPAEGRSTWSYVWAPTAAGTYRILSRAVDDSGNLETPGAGRAIVVASASADGGATITDESHGRGIEAAPTRSSPSVGETPIGNAAPSGWFAGDMHVHRSCGGSPESVSSLYDKMAANNLAVISLLADMGNGEVQNPATDLPKVNGQDDPISTPGRIVHWDAEWHWDATYTQFPHQALGGHIVALGLNQAAQVWEEYTYPIFQWIQARNGIGGFAHMQYVPDSPPSSLDCCTPLEYPVEVALGSAKFISEDVTGSDSAIRAYYRLLNSGFRPGLAGGTDYPCGVSTLGSLLTYVKVANGEMTYRNWIEGIAAGRTVVSRNGQNEFLALTVNGTATPGDQISLTGGGAVSVSVQWTADQSLTGTIELVQNGTVVATLATSAAPGSPATLTTTASFSKSGWLAARRMDGSGHRVHTGAVYVIAGGAPIRASAADAQFFVQWIDNLLDRTAVGGAWASYLPTRRAEARARYQAARDLFQQIAAEAAAEPPSVTVVTPAAGATNVVVGTPVTATFSEPLAPATVSTSTFELRDGGGLLVPATVTWNAATTSAVLQPTSALAFSTTYAARVRGGAGGVTDVAGNPLPADFTWTFTTQASAPSGAVSLWEGGGTPSLTNQSDGQALEVGVKFRSSTPGYVTALRFYKGSQDSGTHVGHLWTGTGTLLATATFTGETASGWQEVALPSPVAIAANTTYVASCHSSAGYYSVTVGYFNQAYTNGPLTALADGTDGGNGVYGYGASAFPTGSWSASNYWVDLVFLAEAPPSDTTPPTVVTTTPASGASGVLVGANVTARFSEPLAPSSVGGASVQLREGAGPLVAAASHVTAATSSAVLDPTNDLSYSTTYSATVKGGAGGVTDVAGNPLAADFTWTFTTEAAPPSGPVTLWEGGGTPSVTNATDGQALEVGVKFRSSTPGYVTALRFYKGSQDSGTHVGHLWTGTGTLLATATFTGETASGWQEVALPSPVAIAAGTTYVASCHSSAGYYSATTSYFNQAYTNGPLTALADGTDGGNGVYGYGASAFPTSSWSATNYWVDLVFSVEPPGPDTTPPSVVTTTPASGASGVLVGANVTARFSEPLAASSVSGTSVQLRDGAGQLVAAAVTWDAATSSAILDPTSGLAYSAAYTATVRGGTGGVTDVAGNPLAADFTWTFTTEAPPPPPPNEGPGGPVLVIGSTGNPFSRYYAEILRTEGLNAFTVADISTIDASVLSEYDVAILGEMPLGASQVAMLTDWVTAGGNLIAMRPDKQLAGLLGLADAGTTLANGYLLVNTATSPGSGIVAQTMQFHGTADRYALAGASAIATLYSGPATATANPAVTLRAVGGNGGEAAAFAFDLARSIVYTRQGNPAWAGQKRDGQAGPIRSDDLFYPDWVNLDKVAIPQADEQQRLLANLILHLNRDRKPLPRFWYFPRGEKAVVIMTSDNHGSQNVETRLQAEDAASAPGCSVDDWECIRSSVYVYTSALPGDATAKLWEDKGFEIALHVNTNCENWTPASLAGFYSSQIADFSSTFPSLAPLRTNRTHCIAWSDWATQPKVELQNGIRVDTNYYYWPPEWVANRPGFFTGSGMPMRFADTDGTMIDVYQATTQMTDESGQSYPATIDTLLDRALGAEGYYGAFTANIHTDGSTESQAAAIVASAKARSVPVVSAKQMLTWLDGRNGSSFESLTWSGGTLTFGVSVAAGGNGLQAMLPASAAGSPLAALTRGALAVPYTTQTIKGVAYAVFVADPGTYEAAYGSDTTPPVISSVSASVGTGGTATVQWGTDEPATSLVRYGTSAGSLTLTASSPILVTAHGLPLTGLAGDTTYYYQVTSVDAAGNSASSAVSSFFVGTVDTGAPTVALVAPNGGERLFTGNPYTIQWTATDDVGVTAIDVALSADGGASFTAVAGCTGLAGTAQSCVWSTPGPATTQGRIRVTARDAAGQSGAATSAANFTVTAGTPSIALTAPNTAVTWSVGTAQAITFDHNLGTGATVVIDLSRDGGASWANLNPGFVTTSATTGSYSWTVTSPATTQARVRVTYSGDPGVSSTSATSFTISETASGTIAVTSPATGAQWGLGTRRTVAWDHTLGAGRTFDILLSTNGGSSFPTTIASGVAAGATSGSYDWVVAGATTTTAQVRVVSTANTAIRGTTGNFRIRAASVTVTAPNTAVNWAIGTTRSITWTQYLGTREAVNIDESLDGGTTWTSIATNVPHTADTTGSYGWVVAGPATTTARIRVTWSANSAVTDLSNRNFTVAAPFVRVTSPNTNVIRTIGSTYTITFSHNLGTDQPVLIELSRDGGATYAPLTTFTTTSATSGSWSWLVAGPATTQGRVRVTWNANPAVTDISNVNFRIQ